MCRRAWVVDGYFSVPRSRFGCPPLAGERTLAVTALPKVQLTAFEDENLIQPGERYDPALPVSESQWFGWALKPATDEQIDEMVALGRQHAREWADRHSSEIV